MAKFWNKHVFSAELPYEKDQPVTLFLKERFEKVDVFIMSLGQMSNIPPSRLFCYVKGKLIGEDIYIKNNLKAAGPILYFIYIPKALFSVTFDLLRSLKKISFKCDIFYAQHFLPAFVAVILRKLGILKCNKIVFRMFDFFPIPSEFLRSLYYRGIDMIQGYVRKHVDEIWYTTPRLLECDKEKFGLLPKTVVKQLVQGYFFQRIETKKPSPPPPLRLAFLGSLRRSTGAYESIDVIHSCIKNGMDVQLRIIGSGPEEKSLKEYAKQKKVDKKITFYGFEDRGEEIAKIFSQCHMALGLYPAHPTSPNWFLTSGRCRRYISQRLPIIITTVPYFAKYIHDYNAGIIVDNNPEDIRQHLQKIYKNPSLLESMRKGVDKLYNMYKADKVLEEAFGKMLSLKKGDN
ncbi:MAG: glycosyltransferase [Candidatus Levyibacteriota bacterium]